MNRKLRLLIFVPLILLLLLAFLVSPAFATSRWRVNVMVAYDEEWESTAFWTYGYSAETLANIIIICANFRFYAEFQIQFRPCVYQFWDSDDNPADRDVMMDEVIDETGFETGMTIGNHVIDVLIAFTDQEIPPSPGCYCYGYVDRILGVILVRHSYPNGVGQATDKVLQHELSHLYDAPEERVRDLDCVMNSYSYYLGFPYFDPVPTGVVTTNWCEGCLEIISSNVDKWGRLVSGGGGGGGDLLCLYNTEGVHE